MKASTTVSHRTGIARFRAIDHAPISTSDRGRPDSPTLLPRRTYLQSVYPTLFSQATAAALKFPARRRAGPAAVESVDWRHERRVHHPDERGDVEHRQPRGLADRRRIRRHVGALEHDRAHLRVPLYHLPGR